MELKLYSKDSFTKKKRVTKPSLWITKSGIFAFNVAGTKTLDLTEKSMIVVGQDMNNPFDFYLSFSHTSDGFPEGFSVRINKQGCAVFNCKGLAEIILLNAKVERSSATFDLERSIKADPAFGHGSYKIVINPIKK